MSSTIAIIPARQGSRRVKDKNIRPLGGIPLIAWTIKTALKTPSINRVIVSTDSEEYAKIARRYGAEVPFLRPDNISNDCDTATVVKHCVEEIEKRNRDRRDPYSITSRYDYVVTLQPTSPFRTPKELEEACQLIRVEGVDSIVSVKPIAEHPAWMFRTDGPVLESFLGFPPRILSGLIAQELPQLVIPDGSIYVSKRHVIEQERIYGDSVGFIKIPRGRSIDLEEEEDFLFAEALLKCQPGLLSMCG